MSCGLSIMTIFYSRIANDATRNFTLESDGGGVVDDCRDAPGPAPPAGRAAGVGEEGGEGFKIVREHCFVSPGMSHARGKPSPWSLCFCE